MVCMWEIEINEVNKSKKSKKKLNVKIGWIHGDMMMMHYVFAWIIPLICFLTSLTSWLHCAAQMIRRLYIRIRHDTKELLHHEGGEGLWEPKTCLRLAQPQRSQAEGYAMSRSSFKRDTTSDEHFSECVSLRHIWVTYLFAYILLC